MSPPHQAGLPRLQSFEFNEMPKIPAAIRESILETLSDVLFKEHYYQPVYSVLEELSRTMDSDILDQCSGSGGCIPDLARFWPQSNPARIYLSDLNPQIEIFEQLRQQAPERIDYVPYPVDATRFDRLMQRWPEFFPQHPMPRIRTIFTAFHHFPPPVAQQVLQDAYRHRQVLVLAEPFDRDDWKSFLGFSWHGAWAMPGAIWNSPHKRWHKRLLTLLLITPMAAAWDDLISFLRIYRKKDFDQMIALMGEIRNYRFTVSVHPVSNGAKALMVVGVPEQGNTLQGPKSGK